MSAIQSIYFLYESWNYVKDTAWFYFRMWTPVFTLLEHKYVDKKRDEKVRLCWML